MASVLAATLALAVQPSAAAEELYIAELPERIMLDPLGAGVRVSVSGNIRNADAGALANGDYEVAITLTGPSEDATISRKEQVLGLWVNGASVSFGPVPQSHWVVTTRAFSAKAAAEEPSLPIAAGETADRAAFEQAYLRLKERQGLYRREPGGVALVPDGHFEAVMQLPVNMPQGVHALQVRLFRKGAPIASRQSEVTISRGRLDRAVIETATRHPLAYGLVCVTIAFLIGWGASLIFKRRRVERSKS